MKPLLQGKYLDEAPHSKFCPSLPDYVLVNRRLKGRLVDLHDVRVNDTFDHFLVEARWREVGYRVTVSVGKKK